jgi:hypothetical protein
LAILSTTGSSAPPALSGFAALLHPPAINATAAREHVSRILFRIGLIGHSFQDVE